MIRTNSFNNLKMDCWTYANQIHKSAKDLDAENFWDSLSSVRKANKTNYEVAVEVLNAYFEYLEKNKTQKESIEVIERAKNKFKEI